MDIIDILLASGGEGGVAGSYYDGDLLIVDKGVIKSSGLSYEQLNNMLIKNEEFIPRERSIGVYIDYSTGEVRRPQHSSNTPSNFYLYRERARCLLDSSNNRIVTHSYDSNYDQLLNTQQYDVMVYIPDYYFCKVPIEYDNDGSIKREIIWLSDDYQPGFKSWYEYTNPDIISYYYSAFCNSYIKSDGTLDVTGQTSSYPETFERTGLERLCSIQSSIPATYLTMDQANYLVPEATVDEDNGLFYDYYLPTVRQEAFALQIPLLVEYCTFNLQSALAPGVTNITDVVGQKCASYTGSTLNLYTGRAASTVNRANGVDTTYTDADKTSVCYRGIEDPWGNVQHLLSDYYDNQSEQTTSGWLSRINITDIDGFRTSNTATSTSPIGDWTFFDSSYSSSHIISVGGAWNYKEYAGPFCYALDKTSNYSNRNLGARMTFKICELGGAPE